MKSCQTEDEWSTLVRYSTYHHDHFSAEEMTIVATAGDNDGSEG